MAAVGSVPLGSHSFPVSSPVRESSGNQHPYAIKTTSTGILTRSNSTGASGKPSYYYASASPSAPSPALGKPQGRGHRHTKSLSNASIPSLPLPPPSPSTPVNLANRTSSGNVSDGALPGKLKRRETLPALSSSPRAPKPVQLSDLHDNPKLWTPSHLSVYLTSALRVKGGGSIPGPVAQDIAAFVVSQRISGRAFLRLSESDLEEMGINQLWRDALLSASRSLRKNIVKGRIWGFGSDSPSALSPPTPHKRRVPSTVEEEDPDQDNKAPPGGFRAGRVRGIVESLERSSSSASSHSSRGSASDFDLDANDEVVRRELKEAGLWDEPQDAGFASGELTSGSELEDDAIPEKRRSMSWGELPKPFPPHEKQLSSSAKTRETDFGDQSTIAADSGAEHYASALSGDEQYQNVNGAQLDQEPTMEELLANEPLSNSWALSTGEEQTMRKVPEVPGSGSQRRKSGIKGLPQLFTDASTLNAIQQKHDVDTRAVSEAAAEATRNAQLVEEFKRRLEEVEKQLGDMEARNARREREAAAERTRRAEWEHRQREAELARASAVHSQDVVVPNSLSSILSSTLNRRPARNSVAKRTGEQPSVDDGLDEMTASALPSYVLLVGMGVCAVVLRVLFRKFPFKRN